MRAEIERLVEEIKQSVGLLRGIFDVETSTARLAELNKLAEDPISGVIRRRRRS